MSGKSRAQKGRDKKGRVAKKVVPVEQPRKISSILDRPRLAQEGARPEDGVQDMTILSDLDEFGINTNLRMSVVVVVVVYFTLLSFCRLYWNKQTNKQTNLKRRIH